MKTVRDALYDIESSELDAERFAHSVIDRLDVGHGHKTWGGLGAIVHSGKTFKVTEAKFGNNCCKTFKIYGTCGDNGDDFGWKADIDNMKAIRLPSCVLLIDKSNVNQHPPIILYT